jgi:hypothetical protein
MTRTTNARVAGVTFLVYIAAGITSLVLFRRATSGEGMPARLARVAEHATEVGAVVLLGFVQCFSAIVLGVTLYAITRDEDADLAMLGLTCRVGEGVIGGLTITAMPTVLWLATSVGADAAAAAAAHVLGGYLLKEYVELPAMFFAVGSTFFAYLLLRGRMVPSSLAWLGVGASVLLVIALPLRLAGFLHGPITTLMWLPMLLFELVLAVWLITKGTAPPARIRAV